MPMADSPAPASASRPWLSALLAFVGALLAAGLVIYQVEQALHAEQRAQIGAYASQQARALETDLNHSLSAALTLATYVRHSSGTPEQFEEIAEAMLELYPGIATLSLSPGGIITMVMPVAGSEGALGLNQLTDSNQRGESLRARDSGQFTLAGPLQLAQGGVGIVGRYPVFLPDAQGQPQFWGFTNVALRLAQVLENSGLDELTRLNLDYRLWRIHPDTGLEQDIARSVSGRFSKPVQHTLVLPNGEWFLSVAPIQGWHAPHQLLGLIALGIAISALLAYLAKLLTDLRQHKQSLERQVELRTREVRAAQAHLDSVINAIPDLLFEMDIEGRYLGFFSHDPERLERPFEQIRGKTVTEVMPAEPARAVLDALSEAASTGYSVGRQFSLMQAGELRHFELSAAPRPMPKDEPAQFIVLSRDITERKLAELDAHTSLARYQTLVAASNTGAWAYYQQRDFLECSPEYFSMLGRHIREFDMSGASNLQATWLELLHPDDRQQANASFRHYLISGGYGMYESRFRMRHRDGHWVWILSRGRSLRDARGELTGMTVGTHIDISTQVDNETKLALAAKVFERGSEGFIITDARQNIVMVNQAFTRITGYSEQEALGQHPRMLASGRHDREFYRAMWTALDSDGLWQGEVWNRRKDGSIYPEWLSISTITDDAGNTSHYIGIISDITRMKQDQEQIHRLAYYDPLTSLPNRSLLEERAQSALGVAHRNGQPLALMFLDLDNFKNVNDSLGHQAGDHLLVAFARRLGQEVREGDTFARPGGDEFVLLLPDTDANGAAHTAQKLLALLSEPFKVEGYELSVTSSIGIAMYPDDGSELSKLYTNADIAMYRAKQKGRNTYSFFTPELQTHYVRTLQLENAMRRALELEQFELYYQPQRDINSGTVIGLEALIRWRHPELGNISPAEFIPIAETSGLILPIGDWVVRQAAAQLRLWLSAGVAPPKIAINLSPIQLRQVSLPERLLAILRNAGLPEEYFEMEITESATMGDPAQAIKLIDRLHQAGVSISIDDFGTGYSSLSYLKRFKIYKLKIDKSFIEDLTEDAEDREIVRTIINLARSLGLRTIAEGVETREQLLLLQELGCDDMQGYLFSKPLSAADTEAFLRRQASIEQMEV